MTSQQPKALTDAFFDQLIKRQAAPATAEDALLQQERIFCGRWLALRRLELGLTLDQLAEQSQLPTRAILFLETALVDQQLAAAESWERYSPALAAVHGDEALIQRIMATALGVEQPPDGHVMARVAADLSMAYAESQTIHDDQLSQAPSAGMCAGPHGTPPSLTAILRWIDGHLGPAQARASGTVSLNIRDSTGATLLTIADIDVQDLRDTAIRGVAPRRLLTTMRGVSESVLATVQHYLGGDIRSTRSAVEHGAAPVATAQDQFPSDDCPPRAYLQALLDECNRAVVPGAAIGPSATAQQKTVPAAPTLAHIYVPLATDGSAHLLAHFEQVSPQGRTWSEHRQPGLTEEAQLGEPISIALTSPELVEEAIARAPRLILLGAPGSGKSTALRHLALRLAQCTLDATAALPARWSAPKIPVLCSLGALAAAIGDRDPRSDDDLLDRLLESRIPGADQAEQACDARLRRALRGGTALLLLDELDTVSDVPAMDRQSVRAHVTQLIERIGGLLPRETHIIVTCRTGAYAQLLDLRLPTADGWQVCTIQPLISGQIRQLTKRWFRRPTNQGRLDRSYAYATAIVFRIMADPELYHLCSSPLALTLLLKVLERGAPRDEPRDRGDIYDQYVAQVLDDLIGAASPPIGTKLRTILQEAAFDRFARSTDTELRLDRPHKEDIELLRRWFPHASIQEFLAACHLANAPGLARHAYALWQGHDDHWHDILLFMIGRLRRLGTIAERGLPWLAAFLAPTTADGLSKSPRQRARDALLAAESYRACGTVKVNGAMTQIEHALATALVSVLSSAATTAERLRAGAHLASLGDPRCGVTTLEPDWCAVPAGPFIAGRRRGNDREPSLESERYLDLAAFQIARYPVTNWLWRQFMRDDGYSMPEWWGGWWQVREHEGWTEPHFWDTPYLRLDNQPVVGISWYEALAFCAWLTARGRAAGWLRTDERVRLPTVLEWEKAARGVDGRTYPWGDTYAADYAHTAELIARAPAPVGCYPQGASPYGALDMSGNVAEWCDDPGAGGLSIGQVTIRRGGSWGEDHQQARCDTHQRCAPGTRGDLLGLRVIAAPDPR